MAQARRQGKGKKKSARTTGTGASWGMLLVGLVSGAVLAALFMGVRDGDYGQLGSGLKSLWQSNSAATPMEASKRG